MIADKRGDKQADRQTDRQTGRLTDLPLAESSDVSLCIHCWMIVLILGSSSLLTERKPVLGSVRSARLCTCDLMGMMPANEK